MDSAKIDTIALMNSREESEQKLHVKQNNRSHIRGGVIKVVHFLPDGDYWSVYNGSKSMTSNTRKLRPVIGVDKTTSIRETENEKQTLEYELKDLTSKEKNLSRERHQYKVQWNNLKKDDKNMRLEIQDLEETISRIQLESAAAENVSVDTSEYEDEVKEAEAAIDQLKERIEEMQKHIEELRKPISDLESKVDETQARSLKVANDLNEASEKYQQYMRSKEQRGQILEKKRSKLQQFEDYRENLLGRIDERARVTGETKFKAQRVTYQYHKSLDEKSSDEDKAEGADKEVELTEEEIKSKIEAIEPLETSKDSQYYRSKIQRGERDIEKERQRRQISEVDPEVALMKYQRAKKDLESKFVQLESIRANEEGLVLDLKDRKKRWKSFRGNHYFLTKFSYCLSYSKYLTSIIV